MPSPGRGQGPLDPAAKVFEMESLGVKVCLPSVFVHVQACQEVWIMGLQSVQQPVSPQHCY